MKYLNILSGSWIAQKARAKYFGRCKLNVPDAPVDSRDWITSRIWRAREVDLKEFSRRDLTPRVKNQGSIGSCVGHSGRVVYGSTEEFKDKEPSAMWIYKKGQLYDPWPGEDYSGTTIRGACKGLVKEGCCEEKYWPDLRKEGAPMSPEAPENALKYKINGYYVIPKGDTDRIKSALLKEPLWTSIKVRRHFFQTDSTGVVNSDKFLSSEVVGGHAVSMIGWKEIDGKLYWEFQNSWGRWFGNKGYFFMEDSLYRDAIINAVGPYYLDVKSEEKEPDPEPDPKPEKKKFNKKYLIIAAMAITALWAIIEIM